MVEELSRQIDQVDDPKLKIFQRNLTKLLKRKGGTGCYPREQSY